MAARKPTLVIGGLKPGGKPPKGGRGGPRMGVTKGEVTLRDAGEVDRRSRKRGSKKGSAGRRAGLGRPTPNLTTGPHPTGHAGTRFKTVQGKKPSLMTRIGNKIGRVFGFRPPRPKLSP
jgi:hypothetical protein